MAPGSPRAASPRDRRSRRRPAIPLRESAKRGSPDPTSDRDRPAVAPLRGSDSNPTVFGADSASLPHSQPRLAWRCPTLPRPFPAIPCRSTPHFSHALTAWRPTCYRPLDWPAWPARCRLAGRASDNFRAAADLCLWRIGVPSRGGWAAGVFLPRGPPGLHPRRSCTRHLPWSSRRAHVMLVWTPTLRSRCT